MYSKKYSLKTAVLFFAVLWAASEGRAQIVAEPKDTPPEWSKPYQPFCIAGNLYYVGTYDLCCYLVTTPEGHILINTGLAASAAQIQANVEALGFRVADIKILLTTQAHYDHMGAMASLKQVTGARLMVNEKDSAVVADGGNSDYALGGNGSSYAPMQPDSILHNGDTVSLGGMHLVMLHHPGHTKGSCSYLLNVKDNKKTYRVLIANMPTIVTEKPFAGITVYRDIASDYAYTLTAMKKLSFDLWLSSHASQFNLHDKHRPGDAYNPAVFIDRKGYDAAMKRLSAQYRQKIADEK